MEIIYQNEINSYTICEVEVEKEIVTAVGYLPFVNCGDILDMHGRYVEHQEYGTQFKVDTFEKQMPKTAASIERYLAGGIIKGIGPATAKKIVDRFGEETLAILKFEPEKLSLVKGITSEKAIDIANEFNEKMELFRIVEFLQRFRNK